MKKETLYILSGVAALLAVGYWKKDEVVAVMKTLTRSEFVQKFAPTVMKIAKGTGLFPSVFMAQAVLESGNGNSTLSAKYNNFFGVKADKSWKGDVIEMPTKEYLDG